MFVAVSMRTATPALYSDTHNEPSAAAWKPPTIVSIGIVATTRLVAGSIRKTEFCVKSPTQTAPAAKAIAAGCTPTRIVFTTRRCTTSTRDTVPLPELADHSEPAPYASPVGCAPTWTPGWASATSSAASKRTAGS